MMEHVDMLQGLNQNINDQAFPIWIKHSVTIDFNFMKFYWHMENVNADKNY